MAGRAEGGAGPRRVHAHALVVEYGGLEPEQWPETTALLAKVFSE